MTRVLAAAMLAALVLAAITPAADAAACSGTLVEGSVQGSSHAHYQPAEGTTVSVHVRGSQALDLDFPGAYSPSSAPHYSLCVTPALPSGDRVHATLEHDGHLATSPEGAGAAVVGGPVVAMPTMQWTNQPFSLTVEVLPRGAVDTTALGAILTFSDPEGDALGSGALPAVSWSWASCDGNQQACTDPQEFVGRPDLCPGAACQAGTSSTSPLSIGSGLVPATDVEHAPGFLWRIEARIQDEHGAFAVANATGRIGISEDIPDARLDVLVGGVQVTAGQKLALGATGPSVLLDASASTDRSNAPVTPASELAFSFDHDGDGTFEAAAGPTRTDALGPGRFAPAVRVQDANGFAEDASGPAFFVNHRPALAGLALPELRVGAAAALDASDVASDPDNAAGDTVFPDDALTYDFDWDQGAEGAGTCTSFTVLQAGTPGSSSRSTLAAPPAEGTCVRLTLALADGLDGVAGSATTIVGNTAPRVTAAALAPADSTGPLRLSYTVADADAADALECAVDWRTSTDGGQSFTQTAGAFGACTGLAEQAALARGEVWSATVRVRDEAATGSSTAAAVTISNSAPLAGAVALPAAADVTTAIAFDLADVPGKGAPLFDQDGDALDCQATWRRVAPGTPQVLLQATAAAPCSDPGLALPAGTATKGQTVRVDVVALERAGAATSAASTSGSLTLGNAAPELALATLAAADGGPLTVGDALRGQATAVDPDAIDQATLACTLTFRKVGAASPFATDTLPCGAGASADAAPVLARGEQWTLTATVTDVDGATATASSAAVRVLNTPPTVAAAQLTPTAPKAGDTLSFRFTPADADGDGLLCEVDWERSTDGATFTTEVDGSPVACSGAQDVPLVRTTQKGEWWRATARVTDGVAAADTAGTPLPAVGLVQVGNTLPAITALQTLPALPRTADDLLAVATTADPDGDPLTCTFRWQRGGVTQATQSGVPCGDGRLPAATTAKGETWTVVAEARDHAANPPSAPAQASLTIANTAPVADAGPDLALPGGATVTLNGTASDADGDALATTWTFVSGPTVVLQHPGAGQVRFTAPLSGTVVLAFAATDGTASSGADQVTVVLDADNDDDGKANAQDNCIAIANPTQADADADLVGDACDATARGHDSDQDGHGAVDDNCPTQANADQADRDGDAKGDACDADDDGDGVPDATDRFPADSKEWTDLDGDGIGDNGDLDDDADGRADAEDNCPRASNPDQADLDLDGLGSPCDEDRDGDGALDGADLFPDNARERADSDGDGVGDTADRDDDNDRASDAQEILAGTDPRNAADSPLAPGRLQAIPDGAGGAWVSFAPAADARVVEYLVFREASPIVLVGRVRASDDASAYLHHDPDAPATTFRYYVQARLPGEGLAYVLGPRSNDVTSEGPVLDCTLSPDGDGDGLCDRMETLWGLDPANADTDGDGRSDGDEALGRGGFSLAWLADSDADGRDDGKELADGSDPLAPRSAFASELSTTAWVAWAAGLAALGAAVLTLSLRRRPPV